MVAGPGTARPTGVALARGCRLVQGMGMPYSGLEFKGVVLLCFPPDDAVLVHHVRRVIDEGAARPSDAEAKLREVYPRIVVRQRDALAGFGETAWYVYRDGRRSPFGGDRWWTSPEAARVVVGPDGGYLEANEPALELLGVTRAELAASHAGDFTTPATRSFVPWLTRLLEDTGTLHSTAILRPRNRSEDVHVEFHLERDPERPGLMLSWFRELPPEE